MDKPSPETVSHVLRSTDLSKFATNFEDTRRQNSLRELTFVVCLPTHGDSRDDHATNEAVFFEALKGLFSLLEKWDQQSPSDGSFKLWLRFEYDIQNSDGPVEYNFNVSKSTAVRRYLDINTTELPVLRRIKSFRISGTFGRVPHPATMCRLAGLFTQLEELNIEYCDPAIKRQEMRKEHRFALAAGLKKLSILSNLSKLKLERNSNCDPANHSFACQDLEDEEHVDVLCESIRQLAEVGRLTELELKNILVSPDLFRDRRSGGTPDNKLCPALRRLKVEDGILSPSGEWWYTGDPEAVEACSSGTDYGSGDDDDSDDNSDTSDDGDDDEKDAIVNGYEPDHQWRTRPDPEMFNPLIKDLANAMRRMPALEWANLDVGGQLRGPFGIVIQAAGRGQAFIMPPDDVASTEADMEVARCKAWIGTSTEWEVPEETKSIWKQWSEEEGKVEVGKWP